jgi:hypothetical protein
MGFHLVNDVLKHSVAHGPARLVLVALANAADDSSGLCWLSLTALGRACIMRRTQTWTAVQKLVALSELKVESRAGRASIFHLLARSEFRMGQAAPPVRISERDPFGFPNPYQLYQLWINHLLRNPALRPPPRWG